MSGTLALLTCIAEIWPAAAPENLNSWASIAGSCGFWWPFERICLLSERPGELHRDKQGNLHSASGPAVRYPDGWSVYCWHGSRVPGAAIENAAGTTVDSIVSAVSAAHRAAMMAQYSASRFDRETDIKVMRLSEYMNTQEKRFSLEGTQKTTLVYPTDAESVLWLLRSGGRRT
jgi:hypothetical protein